jgi:2-oxoglutarate ferredoxin oxidoreductase subunit gamma
MERCRIVFSGSGGQGIITASIILAEAAVLYEGLNAVQSQSYGAEARGGLVRSDVIISAAEINFPKVIQLNYLVCLTQEAYDEFSTLIRPGGLLLSDSYYVKQEKNVDARQVELDMYTNINNKIGKAVVLNVCMLGAFVGLTKIVKQESIIKVLGERIPTDFLDSNRQAFELGLKLALSRNEKIL